MGHSSLFVSFYTYVAYFLMSMEKLLFLLLAALFIIDLGDTGPEILEEREIDIP